MKYKALLAGVLVAVVAVVALLGTGDWISGASDEPTPCERLGADGQEVSATVDIGIEAMSNSKEAGEEAGQFVRKAMAAQLKATTSRATADEGPVQDLRVSVTIVANGKEVKIRSGPCPAPEWVLAADPGDVSVWKDADDGYRLQLVDDYQAFRRSQVNAIVSTVEASIEAIDFDASGARDIKSLSLTPNRLLNALAPAGDVEAASREVAILSPWLSTTGDCLDESTLDEGDQLSAEDLVAQCIGDHQMPGHIEAADVQMEVYGAAHTSDATRFRALDIATVVQQHLTKGS